MYFGDNKDVKFKTDNLHAEFKANPELYKSMYSYIIPVLEERLSAVTEDELQFDDNLMDYQKINNMYVYRKYYTHTYYFFNRKVN